MICSTLNNQYYGTGVGSLYSLGKIELRQRMGVRDGLPSHLPIKSFKLSARKTIFFREISKNLEACARDKKMKNEQSTS